MATIHVPDTGNPTTNMTNLQTAVNNAVRGDIVTLAPGVFYDGSLVLPEKSGTGIVTIRTSAISSLPVGTRVTPAVANFMPKLRCVTNNVPALRTCLPASGVANRYTIQGIEFVGNAVGFGNIIEFGNGDGSLANKQDTLAKVPADLILDRCYVHGRPFIGQKAGIALHCNRATITECYIDECWGIGQDTQSIIGVNGVGNYVIHNNYVGGATENFLMGGDDPRIPDLVPSNLRMTRNDFERNPAWWNTATRQAVPIIGTPTISGSTVGTGGTLAAATYTYRIVARRPVSYQNNLARSTASAAHSRTITAGQTITVTWGSISGATEYYVYRTGPADTRRFLVTGTTFTDTGGAGTVEAFPTTNGTVRTVKNLVELKNWDGAFIRGNRLRYNWVAGQTGFAFLCTPVNQGGLNNATVVQNVWFEYNKIEHSAGVFQLTSHDAGLQAHVTVSQRTRNIFIRHNLCTDIGTPWNTLPTPSLVREFQCSSGNLENVFEGVDNVIYEHNTLISAGMNSMCSFFEFNATLGYPQHERVQIKNNLTRRGSFGINGGNASEGTNALNLYCPGHVVQKNVITGATASLYPANNFFPTEATFQAQFVNYAGGNYELASNSIYRDQATDGTNIGANIDVLEALYAGTTTPDFTVTFTAAAGSRTLFVTTEAACEWSVTSDSAWITLTGDVTQAGSGSIVVNVAANSGLARQGVVEIAGTRVTIAQSSGGAGGAIITLPVGSLTLLGRAPVRVSNFLEGTPAGSLTLLGQTPQVLKGLPVPAGALLVGGLLPTPGRGSGVPIGSLTLTGLAGVLGISSVEQPGVGTLALTGFAGAAVRQGGNIILAPSQGTLAFVGQSPTRVMAHLLSPAAAALTLSGQAPTRTGQEFIATGLGTLTLSGQTPQRVSSGAIAPDPASLLLTGLLPTISTPLLRQPGAGALVFAGVLPFSRQRVLRQMPVGALLLSGAVPAKIATEAILLGGTGALVLLGRVPARILGVVRPMPAGALTLLGRTPTPIDAVPALPSAGSLLFAGLAPALARTFTVGVGVGQTLELQGRAPTANQSYTFALPVGTLLLNGLAGGAPQTNAYAPDAGQLRLSGLTPTAALALVVQPGVGALVLSGAALVIDTREVIPAAFLFITGHLLVVKATYTDLMPVGALTFVGAMPTLSGTATGEMPAGALVLAGAAPTVIQLQTITANVGGLLLAGLAPALSTGHRVLPGVGALLLTGLPPAPVVVAPTAVVTAPSQAELVLLGAVPVAQINVIIEPARSFLEFEGYAPTPSPCGASLDPTGITVGPLGGSFLVAVNIGDTCDWTAEALESWLSVSISGGLGPGSFVVFVAEHTTTGVPREGIIRVNTTTFVVLQVGPTCTFTLSPQALNVSANATFGTISITTSSECAWTATESVSWISLTPTSGTGSGTVNYTIDANTSVQARTTQLSIAGHQVPVVQRGAPPTEPPGQCPDI